MQARFYTSYGNDPIFRLVDGATCPSADVSSIDAKRQAYSLLLHKGLIRIGLSVPATIPGSTVPTEYRIVSVTDPYGCNTNPTTGLTSFGPANPTAGIVSVYRRPLPSTNLGFLTAIMWDGRQPTLAQQSIDATRIHAQGNADPTTAQQQQVVDLNPESSLHRFMTAKRNTSMRPALRVAPMRWRNCLPVFLSASTILSPRVWPLLLGIRKACRSHRRSLTCTGRGSAPAVPKTETKALSNIVGRWRAAKSYSTTRLSILPVMSGLLVQLHIVSDVKVIPPPPPLVALDGELIVKVWSPPGDGVKRRVLVQDPGSLPVRMGERVHIEAKLSRKAFVYLVWVDSRGVSLIRCTPGTVKTPRRCVSPLPQSCPNGRSTAHPESTRGGPVEGDDGAWLDYVLLGAVPGLQPRVVATPIVEGHEGPPRTRGCAGPSTLSIGEFRDLVGAFSSVDIIPERFPVKSRLHKGWKGTLYNAFFVGTFNAMPKVLVQRFGWHLIAICRKSGTK